MNVGDTVWYKPLGRYATILEIEDDCVTIMDIFGFTFFTVLGCLEVA